MLAYEARIASNFLPFLIDFRRLKIISSVNSASSQSGPSVLISVTTAQLVDQGNISMLEGKGLCPCVPLEGLPQPNW